MPTYEELFEKIKNVPQVNGISPVDVLNLPDPMGGVIRDMTRHKTMSLNQLAEELGLALEETHTICQTLVDKGYFALLNEHDRPSERVYRVRFAEMRKRNIPFDL